MKYFIIFDKIMPLVDCNNHWKARPKRRASKEPSQNFDIDESNISKLATKYLGLTSQQIRGRDVFNVLRLWRDAMPYKVKKRGVWVQG